MTHQKRAPRKQRRWGLNAPILTVAVTMCLVSLMHAAPALAKWGQTLTASGTVTVLPPPAIEIESAQTQDALVQNHSYQTTEVVTVRYPVDGDEGGADLGGADVVGGTPSHTRLVVRALPAEGLQQHMLVAVWPVSLGEACTVTSDPTSEAVTGSWTADVTSNPAEIAPGETVQFCVRGYPKTSIPRTDQFTTEQNRVVTVVALGVAGTGTQQFTQAAQYQAQLTFDDESIVSDEVSSTSVIATERMYPLDKLDSRYSWVGIGRSPSLCMYVYGGMNPVIADPGSIVGLWDCVIGTPRNQFQRLTMQSGLIQIRVKANNADTGFLSAISADNPVVIANRDRSDPRQYWIPQSVAGVGTQLVNVYSGQCVLNPTTGYEAAYTHNCSSLPAEVDRFITRWRGAMSG